MNSYYKPFTLLGMFLLLTFTSISPAAAQTHLTYGTYVIHDFDPAQPIAIFSFTGTQNDLVDLQVIGLSSGMALTVSLNNPSGEQVAIAGGDGEVSLLHHIEQDGVYLIAISPVADTPLESIILKIDGFSSIQPVRLNTGSPTEVTLTPDDPIPHVFEFESDALNATTLCVQGDDFIAKVRSFDGHSLGTLNGGIMNFATLTVIPGDESYVILVLPGAEEATVTLSLASSPGGCEQPAGDSTSDTDSTGASPTQTVASEETITDENTCYITGSNVDLYQGPSPDYAVIYTYSGSGEATGVTSNGWYLVSYQGIQGYVQGMTATFAGSCDYLPTVPSIPLDLTPGTPTETITVTGTPPTATATVTTTSTLPPDITPTQTMTLTASSTPPPGATATYTYTPTSTYTPSYTPLPSATATYTYTPSYTPTTTYTPTSPVPVAPPDANFNDPLAIPLDSTTSVTDFVSYPDGDTQDRVRYSVTGMNPNAALSGGRAQLVITASCFGTGTQNIQFVTGGQTYSCGQTIVDREITNDTDTGTININAVGGTNTHVQWVLTGTATRIN